MITEQQFTKLYNNGFARTCDFFHKKGFSPEDCQDLAQEVFLALWRTRKHYNPEYSLVSFWWLKVIGVVRYIHEGRYSDPLDDLIKIRNSDFRGQHVIDSEPDTSDSAETQLWIHQLTSALPALLAKDIHMIVAAPQTYAADRYEALGMKRLAYERQMARIHQDPKILAFIREELRND